MKKTKINSSEFTERLGGQTYLPSRRFSWVLLTTFFIFDNFFSYYAITRLHGREGNLLVAPLVEKYPLLYFLCIPVTLLIVFIIVKVTTNVALKILRKWDFREKDFIERITLGALVIYWAIGNSFMNLVFLLGYRLPICTWALTSFIGISLALIYSFLMLKKLHGNGAKNLGKKPILK